MLIRFDERCQTGSLYFKEMLNFREKLVRLQPLQKIFVNKIEI